MDESHIEFYSVENYLKMEKEIRKIHEQIEKYELKNIEKAQPKFKNNEEKLKFLLDKENNRIKQKEDDFKIKELKYFCLLSEQSAQLRDCQSKLYETNKFLNDEEKQIEKKCRVFPSVYTNDNSNLGFMQKSHQSFKMRRRARALANLSKKYPKIKLNASADKKDSMKYFYEDKLFGKKCNVLSQGINEIKNIVYKSPESKNLKPFMYKKIK